LASGKTYAAIREIFNKQPLVPVGTTPRALQHPLVVRMSGPDEIRRDSASDLQPHSAIARSSSSLSIPSTAENRAHRPPRGPTVPGVRRARRRAPSASAFTMSVPRRMPPSTSASARPLVVCASVIVIEHRQRQDFHTPLLRTPRGSRVPWAASSASVLVQRRVMIDPPQRT